MRGAADASMRTAGGLPADDPLRRLSSTELAALLDDVITSWSRDGIPPEHDPITDDIVAAVDAGHFDQRVDNGPSELETTPALELYEQVRMMSPERRRTYLAQKGNPRPGHVPPKDRTDDPVVDPNRLRRALLLTVTPRGVGTWEVHGGHEPHQVIERDGQLTCDCIDHRIRGTVCKHSLAVMLPQGSPAVLRGLRELVQEVSA